ncbi:MAG: hypothetical protein RML84_11275 [Anaerolineae bacterium]|nr:hypothetical protein [Anaerolineae bacterium]
MVLQIECYACGATMEVTPDDIVVSCRCGAVWALSEYAPDPVAIGVMARGWMSPRALARQLARLRDFWGQDWADRALDAYISS